MLPPHRQMGIIRCQTPIYLIQIGSLSLYMWFLLPGSRGFTTGVLVSQYGNAASPSPDGDNSVSDTDLPNSDRIAVAVHVVSPPWIAGVYHRCISVAIRQCCLPIARWG